MPQRILWHESLHDDLKLILKHINAPVLQEMLIALGHTDVDFVTEVTDGFPQLYMLTKSGAGAEILSKAKEIYSP